jgi:hypothetical protein
MSRLATVGRILAAALAACFFQGFSAGCKPPGAGGKAPPAKVSDATYRAFGTHELHCNAIRTDELQAGIASAYGIERRRDRVMINVVLLGKLADGRTAPVDGRIVATVSDLTGRVTEVAMRRLAEGAAIDFIGQVELHGEERLAFDVSATAADGSGPFTIRFERDFDDR